MQRRATKDWLLWFAIFYVLWGYGKKLLLLLPDSPIYWTLTPVVDNIPFVLLVGLVASKRLDLKRLGLASDAPLRVAKHAALVLAVFCTIVFVLRYPVWALVGPFEYADVGNAAISPVSQTVRTVLLLEVLVVTSFMEEIVYRGILFSILPTSKVYVGLSSFLFATVHFHQGLLSMVINGLIGVAACLIFLRVRNVLPLALGHLGLNLLVFASQS